MLFRSSEASIGLVGTSSTAPRALGLIVGSCAASVDLGTRPHAIVCKGFDSAIGALEASIGLVGASSAAPRALGLID